MTTRKAGERPMEADEMRKDGIREWLLAGGGGFEGTPEASTFSFEGLIDYIDAFAVLAVDEALAREAGEPRNPEGALTPVGEENRLKQGTPPCCEFEWLGNRCSLPEGHEADHEIYDARRGEGMRRKRKTWVVLSMPPWGWCVTKRGENFMYAKFHREMPNAKREAQECAKRMNAMEPRP